MFPLPGQTTADASPAILIRDVTFPNRLAFRRSQDNHSVSVPRRDNLGTDGFPIGPYTNFKVFAQFGPEEQVTVNATVRSPLGGAGLSANVGTGQFTFSLYGPQLNFSLGYGVILYVGPRISSSSKCPSS